jgi:hypothetical protein
MSRKTKTRGATGFLSGAAKNVGQLGRSRGFLGGAAEDLTGSRSSSTKLFKKFR